MPAPELRLDASASRTQPGGGLPVALLRRIAAQPAARAGRRALRNVRRAHPGGPPARGGRREPRHDVHVPAVLPALHRQHRPSPLPFGAGPVLLLSGLRAGPGPVGRAGNPRGPGLLLPQFQARPDGRLLPGPGRRHRIRASAGRLGRRAGPQPCPGHGGPGHRGAADPRPRTRTGRRPTATWSRWTPATNWWGSCAASGGGSTAGRRPATSSPPSSKTSAAAASRCRTDSRESVPGGPQ